MLVGGDMVGRCGEEKGQYFLGGVVLEELGRESKMWCEGREG